MVRTLESRTRVREAGRGVPERRDPLTSGWGTPPATQERRISWPDTALTFSGLLTK